MLAVDAGSLDLATAGKQVSEGLKENATRRATAKDKDKDKAH